MTIENLSEFIGKIANILEDAKDENDWKLVQSVIDLLDDVYDELSDLEN